MARKARPVNDRQYLQRRSHLYKPRQQFILFCEGKKTEPAYFRAYRHTHEDALIDIVVENPGSDPLTLAEAAVAHATELGLVHKPGNEPDDARASQSYEENDRVWVVFDRDDHPKNRLNEAIQLYEANGIGIAFSNPCFELWLILHEEDYNKPDGRDKVQAHYKGLRPEYDPKKGKSPDCADLVQRVDDAVVRSERQHRAREEDGAERPLTTVFRLIQEIKDAAAKFRG